MLCESFYSRNRYVSMNLMDLGKLLLIQEEASSSALKNSIDKLNATIAQQTQQAQQKVTAPTTTNATIGKTKYFSETKENYITSGTLFSTTKNTTFKIFKLATSTAWTNLSIYIDKQLYLSGDFAYYDDIGMAYYNPVKDEYIFHLEDENFADGVEITIDKGLYINVFTIIGKITEKHAQA